MGRVTATKAFSFCYGHYLAGHPGKCKNVHGHNSVLEVEVGMEQSHRDTNGNPDMVIDFGDLGKLVKPLIEKVDHQMLNDVFHTGRPTAEYLVEWFANNINAALPRGLYVSSVKLTETPDNWATWSC